MAEFVFVKGSHFSPYSLSQFEFYLFLLRTVHTRSHMGGKSIILIKINYHYYSLPVSYNKISFSLFQFKMDRLLKTDRFFGCMSIRTGCMLLSLFQFTVCFFQLLRIVCDTNKPNSYPELKLFHLDAMSPAALPSTCMDNTVFSPSFEFSFCFCSL